MWNRTVNVVFVSNMQRTMWIIIIFDGQQMLSIFMLSFFLVPVGCYHLCYHLMLSFIVIISPLFLFPENVTHSHCYTVVLKMSSKHNIVTIPYELFTICLMLAEIPLLLNKCYCQALRSDVGKKNI
jgi:hypothetical protein